MPGPLASNPVGMTDSCQQAQIFFGLDGILLNFLLGLASTKILHDYRGQTYAHLVIPCSILTTWAFNHFRSVAKIVVYLCMSQTSGLCPDELGKIPHVEWLLEVSGMLPYKSDAGWD
jgi:hypothetical protein